MYLRSEHSRLGQDASLTVTATAPVVAPTSLLNAALSVGVNQLVIRSQITPDITIDLSQVAQGGPPQAAVQGQGNFFLNFIKPEIELDLLGVSKIVAPYGVPTQNYSVVFGAIAIGLFALGVSTAVWFCRKI